MKKLVLFLNNFRNHSERQAISGQTEIIYSLSEDVPGLLPVTSQSPYSGLKRSSISALMESVGPDIVANNLRTFIVLPSTDILFTELTIPAKQFRQVQKALPYLIEDQIASDPEECFIAIGTKSGDRVPTAIIKREIIKEWINLFSGFGIQPEKMVADIGLLETRQNQHRLDILDGYAMLHLTSGKYYGFQQDFLPVYLKKLVDAKQLKKAEGNGQVKVYETRDDISDTVFDELVNDTLAIQVNLYSTLSFDNENNSVTAVQDANANSEQEKNIRSLLVDIEKHYDLNIDCFFSFQNAAILYQEMATKISARSMSSLQINLLQGEFKVKRALGSFVLDINWKPAAIFLASLCVIYIAGLLIETLKYQNAAAQAEVETKALFKEIFPNTTNYTAMKSRVSELVKQGGNGKGAAFLTVFYQFSEAVHTVNANSNGALQPSQIQFDESGEFKVDIIAENFESLNALKEKAELSNLQLEISSTNAEKTGIKGRLIIRLKE